MNFSHYVQFDIVKKQARNDRLSASSDGENYLMVLHPHRSMIYIFVETNAILTQSLIRLNVLQVMAVSDGLLLVVIVEDVTDREKIVEKVQKGYHATGHDILALRLDGVK
jgi:hypothetical protein